MYTRDVRSALLLVLFAAPAAAVDLNAHAEAVALLQLEPDFSQIHGGELLLDVSAFGVGVGLGGLYEEVGADTAWSALGILQIRPGSFIGLIDNRFVYPHIETGVILGTLAFEELRAGYVLGGGLDFRLSPGSKFVIASATWRWSPSRTPGATPEHTLLLGLGFRGDDD